MNKIILHIFNKTLGVLYTYGFLNWTLAIVLIHRPSEVAVKKAGLKRAGPGADLALPACLIVSAGPRHSCVLSTCASDTHLSLAEGCRGNSRCSVLFDSVKD